jgi:hypothetical protein
MQLDKNAFDHSVFMIVQLNSVLQSLAYLTINDVAYKQPLRTATTAPTKHTIAKYHQSLSTNPSRTSPYSIYSIQTFNMGYDQAGVTRSLNTIQNELQYLASQGVVAPPQLQSIQAQLPVSLTAFSQLCYLVN